MGWRCGISSCEGFDDIRGLFGHRRRFNYWMVYLLHPQQNLFLYLGLLVLRDKGDGNAKCSPT